MKKAFFLLLICGLILALNNSALALYQWVDKEGNLHISDYAPEENKAPEEQAAQEPEKPRAVPQPSPAMIPPPPSPVKAPPAPAPAAPGPTQQAPQAVIPQPASVPTITMQAAPMPPPAPIETQPQPMPFSAPQPGQNPPPGLVAALVGGFLMVILIISLAVYVYFSLCLYLIAKKRNLDEAWAAWVPIIQVWPFLSAAGKPLWWFLLFFVPFVNLFIGVYLWMCIAENLGRNKWLGLLMLIPILNFVVMGVLAFSKPE